MPYRHNPIGNTDDTLQIRCEEVQVPNVKVDWYSQETNEVFDYFGCFWLGCLCMPYRHIPIGNTDETLQIRCEEVQARLQRMKDAGYNVALIWGCEFRKLLRENPGLENEFRSHPYVKNSPINIRDALYARITEVSKTYYRVNEGRISTVWTL